MSDLISEVLKSNELRMDGDYSFSLENGKYYYEPALSQHGNESWAKHDTRCQSVRYRQCYSSAE